MAKYTTIEEGFAVTGVDSAMRHLFLCLGPDCTPLTEGQRTWDYLKRRCGELKVPVMRTKADCLRVCVGGPWLLIYPDGTWYGNVTVERCEHILQQHIVGGKPVAKWIARTHPLPPPPAA